jgi:predicted DNA-binding protein
MNEQERKVLSLRMESELHERLKKVSHYRRLSINEYILNALEKEISHDENLMANEEQLLRGAKIPCPHCNAAVSFLELKSGQDICPSCSKRIRLLKPTK